MLCCSQRRMRTYEEHSAAIQPKILPNAQGSTAFQMYYIIIGCIKLNFTYQAGVFYIQEIKNDSMQF